RAGLYGLIPHVDFTTPACGAARKPGNRGIILLDCGSQVAAGAVDPAWRCTARGLLPTPAMLDRSLGGIRCRTARRIAHHAAYLPGKLVATVRYTTDNLGRTLGRVDCDFGVQGRLTPATLTLA